MCHSAKDAGLGQAERPYFAETVHGADRIEEAECVPGSE